MQKIPTLLVFGRTETSWGASEYLKMDGSWGKWRIFPDSDRSEWLRTARVFVDLGNLAK